MKKATLGVYKVIVSNYENECCVLEIEAKTIYSASLFLGKLINRRDSRDGFKIDISDGYKTEIHRDRDIVKRSPYEICVNVAETTK